MTKPFPENHLQTYNLLCSLLLASALIIWKKFLSGSGTANLLVPPAFVEVEGIPYGEDAVLAIADDEEEERDGGGEEGRLVEVPLH